LYQNAQHLKEYKEIKENRLPPIKDSGGGGGKRFLFLKKILPLAHDYFKIALKKRQKNHFHARGGVLHHS